MKQIINLLAIVANIAICTNLITDTYHRFGATKSKKEVTPCSNDEYDTI